MRSTLLRCAAVALALLGISFSAQAAKKPADFTDFAGFYTGAFTFQATSSAPVYTGSATINVTVPQNGRTAMVTVDGLASDGTVTSAIHNVFNFRGKAATAGDLVYQLLLPTLAPGSGTFTAHKRKVSFAILCNSNGTPILMSGAMAFHPEGKRKQVLTFATSGSVNGISAYFFTFTVSKKVKPAK